MIGMNDGKCTTGDIGNETGYTLTTNRKQFTQ